MDQAQTVICMRWGRRYGADYVNRLHAMVRRHTGRPLRFVCFTDDFEGYDQGIELKPLPAIDLPERVRWLPWRKIALWQSPLEDITGDVLFFDVDLIITGSIDPFFDHAPDETFIVAENWTQPGSGIGNTSCYRFRVGAHSYLYDKLMADPAAMVDKYRISQVYISREIRQMSYWPEGWCVSFKHSLMPRWPLNHFRTPRLPEETRVVAFTGKPDPDEARDGRWPAPWYKKIYKAVKPTPWIGEHWG
ncbi:MAG: hypothetical protein GVY06_03955 [Alphaproteobacteria bacterium]|jgi:hypothetical protein|nr:hypothetical protein [Alphaproteobacteria bacterium]